MKARATMKKACIRTMVWVLVFSITLPAGVFAQGSDIPPVFRQEELEQMLAPIALYPDPLLVQMLMAATYPLEVVEAARWAIANPDLKGDQLAFALEQKSWDPSVKSLVDFPNALAMMDGNLDWTQRLGDAFLAQKDQVMDTIQYLRGKAQAQGNLMTTAEQVVTNRDETIVIEPANPQVIYVPVYNPAVVYGSWWYPDYPPYYYYPPGYVIGSIVGGIINFGVGLFLGAAWWGYAWGGFDWYNHGVYCNPYRYNNYNYRNYHHGYANRPSPGPGGHGEWRHDPGHRRNVAYRDTNTRQRYGQTARPLADARKDLGRHIPDSRNTGARMGDRLKMEQRRDITGHDRTAINRRVTTPVKDRAASEHRMGPPSSGRTIMDKRQDAPVVERMMGQQRREARREEAMRPTTQHVRQTTALAHRGANRPSYQGTINPSFRSTHTVNTSNRGGNMMNRPQRVETIKPSSQGRGAFSGAERGGFSGNGRGGFSGRAGGSGGRS